MSPADLQKHGVPAANAGAQMQQDRAEDAKALQQPKKKYKIGIASRGADGRASQFHVEEA